MKGILFIITFLIICTLSIYATDQSGRNIAVDDSIVINPANPGNDTLIATYANPRLSDSGAVYYNNNDSVADKLSDFTGDAATYGTYLMNHPGLLVDGGIINSSGAGIVDTDNQSNEETSGTGRASFTEAPRAWLSSPQIEESDDAIVADVSGTDIPIEERFVLRSLDRNTAVVFIMVDGGGSAEFNWTTDMVSNTITKSREMLLQASRLADSCGIIIGFKAYFQYVPITAEPILCPAGVNYGSAELWGESDLDPWHSEVIGNVYGPNNERYSANLRGFFDLIGDVSKYAYTSQVAVVFVINSDTLKTHPTGVSPNWAAGWNFQYRFSKPYCTVERRGGAVSTDAYRWVAMHEFFHLFGAADEYEGSYDCSDQDDCGKAQYGMLLATNNNCAICGGVQHPCIMNDPINQHGICQYTARALGWVDSDNNGGGDVDDLPVDYTALVTGSFNLGDYFCLRTLSGSFVNAFRVSTYNSYLQPSGQRTIQVLGMNYQRTKISPGIYYGSVNGGSPFALSLSLNNSHPAATVSNYSSYGPYFAFTVNGVAHVNMTIKNPRTGEWWYPFTGDLLAGSNTEFMVAWKGYEWVADGSYPNKNWGWVCDGVNMPLSTGYHPVAYGPPAKWDMQSLTYDTTTEEAHAVWVAKDWTEEGYLMQNSTVIMDELPVNSFGGYWYNRTGSDSCNVYLKATNPNGASYSDSMYFITKPHIPREIQFTDVYQTICQPDIVNSRAVEYDPKDPWPCTDVTHKINAIAVSGIQPDLQRIENIIGYLVRQGHYVEYPPGSHSYIWKKDSTFFENYGGAFADTIFDLDPLQQYSVDIITVDKFGGKSKWGLPVYQNIVVGETAWNEPDDPGNPPAGASKIRATPREYAISQNRPNPFNPTTTINLGLPVATDWEIKIYNIIGEKVQYLSGYSEAGYRDIKIDMTDMPSGLYLYRVKAGSFTATKKMILLK